jgi:hypothetical protein
MAEDKTVVQQYIEAIAEKAKVAQESGDIPTSYAYDFNDKRWVLTLPRSVMTQKRMIHVRNQYLQTNSFESEEELLGMIVGNTTVAGHQVSVNELEYTELEVLKTAYLDELLLPLSLGGDKAVGTYMGLALGKSPKA